MQKGIIFLTTLSYLASAGIAQEKILPPALSSLVASERAFAHLSVEKGVREAFLAFFAEEGINQDRACPVSGLGLYVWTLRLESHGQ